MKKVFNILLFLITVAMFSSLLPYPVFSNHTNITEHDAKLINDHHESELSATFDSPTKLLSADFETVNVLLPVGEEFDVIDLQSRIGFRVKRTGGKNHLDIEPVDNENAQIARNIADFSWARRPALVKLNESAFLPASIVLFPHGYTSVENNMSGHLCLHFTHSKTDGTNEEDFSHQQTIKKAEELGKKFIKHL